MYRRKPRTIPEISTASLPDIIFMLLFFFMVVTVLRNSSSEIKVYLPSVFHFNKIDLEPGDIYLWIGKAGEQDDNVLVQLNDKVFPLESLEAQLTLLKQKYSIEDLEEVQVHLQADRSIQMRYLAQAKTLLRKLDLRKLIYHIEPNNLES